MSRQRNDVLPPDGTPSPTDRGKHKPHFGSPEAAERNLPLADLENLCARRIVKTQKIRRPSATKSDPTQSLGSQSSGFLHAPDAEQFWKKPNDSCRLRRGLRLRHF
jgi:hypothetical protein